MVEPWGKILEGLMGPYGVIVALSVVIYFLWKLFREEQKEARDAWGVVEEQTGAVNRVANELEIIRRSR